MLDLFEKISAGVSMGAVGVLGLLYLIVPLPTNMPPEFREPVSWTPTRQQSPRRSLPLPQPPPRPKLEVKPATGLTDAEIKKKLMDQGVRTPAGKLERLSGKVPQSLLEDIKVETNWMEELKLAKSRALRTPRGDRRLELEWIDTNSRLNALGFQNRDVIELIDGESIEYNEQSSTRYYRMFKEKIRKLENGESLSVTISRDGQPIHLEFSL